MFHPCLKNGTKVRPIHSDLYALDTWHIVTGGLTPERLTNATAVFITLTAPSFGPVHTHHADEHDRPCRPAAGGKCPHKTAPGCSSRHRSGDPEIGSPLCTACYDYEAHVLTTWWFPSLWNRYTRTLRRLVARHTPRTEVSFVKVMEMQTRVAPHYHAILRATNDSNATGLDADTLASLAISAASTIHLRVPATAGTRVLRFGSQTDAQPLAPGETTRRVAGYLAKYVTKGVTIAPLPARIPAANIHLLPIPDHHQRIMNTLIRLATALPDTYASMTDRLGTLGWRGHTTTKSRTFSTTMTAQKQKRAQWRAAHTPDQDHAANTDDTEWEYTRSGHKSPGRRYLAITAALKHRERLRTASTANDITTRPGTSP